MIEKATNLPRKQLIILVLCLLCAITSFVAVAPHMEKPQSYPHTIESLDNKRSVVLEMSAALVGISVAVAVVPGDATTPLANEISRLNSYLIIALGAIMLLKFLLPIIAFAVWRVIIPLALVLGALYAFLGKKVLRQAGIAIGIFGLLLTLLIPTGVVIGDLIDTSFGTQDALTKIKKDVKEVTDTVAGDFANSDKNNTGGSSGKKKKTKNVLDSMLELKDSMVTLSDTLTEKLNELEDTLSTSATQLIEQVKVIIGDVMDMIAVLLITTCVIPVVTLLIMIALIKFIFKILLKTAGLDM